MAGIPPFLAALSACCQLVNFLTFNKLYEKDLA